MNAEPTLDVEISIANTNNRDLLRGCLGSLPGSCDGLAWHASVVDNASTDGSAEMVLDEFCWVALLRNPVMRGFSTNHNQVLRRAVERGARYILILNEDTVLEPGSVRELVSFCQANPRIGAAGPIIRGSDGLVQHSFFRYPTVANQAAACLWPGRPPREATVDGWLNGSCVLVRGDALRQVGLLDERYYIFFEDTDLGLRLCKAGWQSAVCSDAHILHYGHQVVSQPVYGDQMERQALRSRYLYFRKHHGTVRAGAVDALVKCALTVRAVKAFVWGALSRRLEERSLATVLWALARYDPRVALSHERTAIGSR